MRSNKETSQKLNIPENTIMHARLAKNDLLIYLRPNEKDLNITIQASCLVGDANDLEEAKKQFNAFSENGKVIDQLELKFWGACYG